MFGRLLMACEVVRGSAIYPFEPRTRQMPSGKKRNHRRRALCNLSAAVSFDTAYAAVRPAGTGDENRTMVSDSKLRHAWYSVVHSLAGVEGDIVECGVYRGGTSMIMALAELHALRKTRSSSLDSGTVSRTLWLYDTYEGLPPPDSAHDDPNAMARWTSAVNASMLATAARDAIRTPYFDRQRTIRWNYGPIRVVANNMARTRYPRARIRYVKGKVEKTLHLAKTTNTLPEKIALLRLDTDWYHSTKVELEMLAPRLVPGAVLIIDDYCSWAGAKKAVDEWLLTSSLQFEKINKMKHMKFDPMLGRKVAIEYQFGSRLEPCFTAHVLKKASSS